MGAIAFHPGFRDINGYANDNQAGFGDESGFAMAEWLHTAANM